MLLGGNDGCLFKTLVIPLICLSKKTMLNISEKYDELQLKRQKLKDEIILRIDWKKQI